MYPAWSTGFTDIKGNERMSKQHQNKTEIIIPAWIWLFLFGEERAWIEGEYLIIETRGFIGRHRRYVEICSLDWYEWLLDSDTFSFYTDNTRCVFYKERRETRYYWYAYNWQAHNKRVERVYVGKLETLSLKEITQKVMLLEEMALLTREEITRRRQNSKRQITQRKQRLARALARRSRANQSVT